ncbi:hypothetical protein LCGC14_0849590 [marine sediment metagenome]|uniref:Uncharacterized protein n=1 Tax=marine sediment metagenome TaxID=412755 RepID=A0A0F9RVJ0_9ZZZZ
MMLAIVIVQLNSNYFWRMQLDDEDIARSAKIESLEVIEAEVKVMCQLCNCEYLIDERR